jgi:hypothetical protein
MTPKTTAARVAALRQRRAALGLKRLELYLHPGDHAEIRRVAEKLQKRRAALATAKSADVTG